MTKPQFFVKKLSTPFLVFKTCKNTVKLVIYVTVGVIKGRLSSKFCVQTLHSFFSGLLERFQIHQQKVVVAPTT